MTCQCKNRVEVKFAKVKEGAIIPSKRDEDAGLDIYACFDGMYIIIEPHETVMIPTGIASVIPITHYGQLFEKGGTGTKGIGQRSGAMDSGYRGEWMIPLTNHNSDKAIIIYDYNFTNISDIKSKLAVEDIIASKYANAVFIPHTKSISQVMILPVPELDIEEITIEELLSYKSERMDGKLGSSGK